MALLSVAGVIVLSALTSAGLNRLSASISNVVNVEMPIAENVSDIEILQLKQAVALERAIFEALRHGAATSGFQLETTSFASTE